MKTISIINLKGGVAKTLTADNMAHVLAVFHNKRVLLVDNDKQGNTSKAFGVHSYDEKSLSDILTARRIDPHEVIKKTRFQNIDVLPANMTLIRANLEVMMDSTRPQQTRLRAALGAVTGEYDYCIIDNAPDINISTINALVASDDVIIPIKIDKYAFDGLAELKEQIEDTRDDLNPRLRLAGCLITCFQRTDADRQGEEWLKAQPEYPVFDTHIRYSEKVTESTFSESPLLNTADGAGPLWTISRLCGSICGGASNERGKGRSRILQKQPEKDSRLSMRYMRRVGRGRLHGQEILPGGILARLRRPGRVPGSVQAHRGARKNRSTSVNCPNRTERGLHHGKV
ncbi:MAG: ParA family protein [Oscillospiraceae bacterium]